MNGRRPSVRELAKKLEDAKSALKREQGFFVNRLSALRELEDLAIRATNNVWPILLSLLEEIGPEHYAGTRPPVRSYEAKVYGRELFAFVWVSAYLRKKMNLKFALHEGRFYYVSLHISRPKGEP